MPADSKAILQRLLDLLGFTATVEEHHMDGGVLLDVKTEDSGRLIGRQGQTLGDLQYLIMEDVLVVKNPDGSGERA